MIVEKLTCLCCVSVLSRHSWQPERQLPFSDVRLPPPTDYHKDIGEGEEVEVRPAALRLFSFVFFNLMSQGYCVFALHQIDHY